MKHTRFVFGFLICALVHTAHTAFAQGTTFTYQGRLGQGGAVANGLYDLRFALYDATNGGTAQGASLTNATVTVSNGLFAVPLDFGSGVFDGSPRWLEIGVRTNGSGAAHTILSPRQIVGSTPYAVRAGNFSGAISDSQLSGNIARLNSNVVFSGNVQFGTNLNGLRVAGGNLLNGLLYNSANGYGNFINGGTLDPQGTNAIIGGALNMIGGGKGNHIQGSSAVSISSGEQNRITNSSVSGIGSGNGNVLSGAIESYVGGGCLNRILDSRACGIPSGWGHTIRGDSWWSVIAGGSYCWMSSNNYCAISGGWTNRIEKSESSAIGGGYLNLIESANGATIDGGYANSIGGGASYATIAGGHENTILTNGRWGMIAGGWQNLATNYAFAAGHRAKSIHTGAFVWADSANADFASTTPNQFNVRSGGGIRLETGGAGATLDGQPVLAGYTFGNEITANNGLRLIDANIWLRNDNNHGLGWYGTGKSFASAMPDGP